MTDIADRRDTGAGGVFVIVVRRAAREGA